MIGEITARLLSNGFRIGDLTVKLWHEKGIDISHEEVKKYCRSPNRKSGDPKVWKAIDECLKEMEVA